MGEEGQHWADAFILLEEHGGEALQHVQRRIDTLMAEGDDTGMLRWFEIFLRLEEIAADRATSH